MVFQYHLPKQSLIHCNKQQITLFFWTLYLNVLCMMIRKKQPRNDDENDGKEREEMKPHASSSSPSKKQKRQEQQKQRDGLFGKCWRLEVERQSCSSSLVHDP